MSGQLHGAAAFQQRFRQRLTLFGQSSTAGIGSGDQQQTLQLWPDDPVIDGVKRQLNIDWRIGFEPIGKKFARIAFFVKKRMALRLDRLTIVHECPEKSSVQLIVRGWWKSGVILDVPFIIPLSGVKEALHSLFHHVRKWSAIRFVGAGHIDAVGETTWDWIVAQLLDAILEESGEVIDIRMLYCGFVMSYGEKLADFVRRCAPNLRYLNIPFVTIGGSEQPLTPLPALAQAICTCTKLRRLGLDYMRSEQFSPEFLCQILALPKLSSVVLGNSPSHQTALGEDGIEQTWFTRRHFFPERHRLSIDENWLQAVGRLSDFSVLKKVQHFQLLTDSQVDEMLDVVWRIVAEMHWPAFVDLDYVYSIVPWEQVFEDYLPMVYRTGADVERNMVGGLPTITAEELQEGLATMPPLVQLALTTPPDLATTPVIEGRYPKLEFTFASGAKIAFKKCQP